MVMLRANMIGVSAKQTTQPRHKADRALCYIHVKFGAEARAG